MNPAPLFAAPPDWPAPCAGVDEAGRGPLAGPVVAAAVILGSADYHGIRDSKKLSAAQREAWYGRIVTTAAACAVAVVEAEEIDRLNILVASLEAMRRAVEALAVRPRFAVVDGPHRPPLAVPCQALVGGDARVAAISAAAIVAKVSRDRLMVEYDRRYPGYGFARHKGYPTAEHLAALNAHGPCAIHRRTYAPVRRYLATAATPAEGGESMAATTSALVTGP